uniref:Dynein axonemal assembly factor 5 TPR repeats domain-containing protein n=1 Tax=Phlebotomus papatasi TaxID=29031 RepID=A0A1B0DE37_PHLPP
MECLEHWPNLGHLKCFIAMFVGSGPSKWSDCIKISKLLISLSINLDSDFQNHLLMITEILVGEYQAHGKEEHELEKNLYRVLVTILALSEEESLPGRIITALMALGQPTSADINDLHRKHLESVVKSIEDLDSTNSERSEPILFLYGLLFHCGFHIPAFSALQDAVETVMTLGCAEAKIKILCGVSAAMLKWPETIHTSLEGRVAMLRAFLDTNIVPGLVWKAGFSAESIRAMCATVVAAAARGAPEESFIIVPDIVDHLIVLLDDNLVVIRKYAIASLMASGPLLYDQLRLMAFGFMARLDDPSAEIRYTAAKALTTLKLKAGLEIGQADAWKRVVKEIFSKILIHLDDPDENLRAELVEQFGGSFPTNTLKGYGDKYESCRTVAASVITEMLEKLPENEFYLAYVIPTIARRIGQKELVEESEELRLQLLEQLTGIVMKYSGRNPVDGCLSFLG